MIPNGGVLLLPAAHCPAKDGGLHPSSPSA